MCGWARTLSLPVSFVLCFLDWIGLTAAMGFIAYVFGTFLGQAVIGAGLPAGALLLTPARPSADRCRDVVVVLTPPMSGACIFTGGW